MKIFDLYKKESFTEEDDKLIDEAIENGVSKLNKKQMEEQPLIQL